MADRDDSALAHFHSRAQRPNTHKRINQQAALSKINGSEGAGLKEGLDASRKYIHVGTSPRLSTNDQIQARRRLQYFMRD